MKINHIEESQKFLLITDYSMPSFLFPICTITFVYLTRGTIGHKISCGGVQQCLASTRSIDEMS